MDLNYVTGSIALVIVYFIWSTAYNLFLSPISKIPGPKLAAASWWYEYYHDVVTYGKYIFSIMDMHKKYGPIVRISPHEVHISDPDFYETLYASSSTNRKDRWAWYTNGLGLPVSTLGTVETNIHRRRRAAMSPFFSKQKAAKLQPVVEERATKLMEKLARLAASGEVVPINYAFSAFANGRSLDLEDWCNVLSDVDVVTQYCFGQSDHHIEADGFDPSFHKSMNLHFLVSFKPASSTRKLTKICTVSFSAGISNTMMRNNNWMMTLTKSLPEKIAMSMSAEFSSFVALRRVKALFGCDPLQRD